jgi:tetratricopeptide (TPR) repeat protein
VEGPSLELRLLGPGARPIRPAVLARIAERFPETVSRTELALSLWPDEATAATAGRLRVALSRLRQTVPLVERDDQIGLDASRAGTDLAEVRAALRRASEEPDPAAEAEVLASVWPRLTLPLLPGLEAEWASEARIAWSVEAGGALIRLARLWFEAGRLDGAAAALEDAIRLLPWDDEAWSLLLRIELDRGRADEALRAFAAARRALKAGDGDFSAETVETAEAVRGRLYRTGGGYPLGPVELDVLAGFFARAMESEPRAALAVLASTSLRPEVFRHPRPVLRLLRDVLAKCPEPSEERERAQVRAIGCLAALEDDEAVIAEAERFLASQIGDSRRRIALLNVSFSLFAVGRHEEALSALDQATEIAERTGWPYDAWQCRCQRATLVALMGRPDEALPVLEAGLDYFDEHPVAGAERDVATIRANFGLALLEAGRADEAVRQLRAADALAQETGDRAVVALTAPLLGHAEAEVGEPAAARSALLRGLRAAYREGNRRMIALALLRAGSAMQALGRRPAWRLARSKSSDCGRSDRHRPSATTVKSSTPCAGRRPDWPKRSPRSNPDWL